MSPLTLLSIKIISRISGNRIVQKMLQKNIFISQYFMGIGSGGSVLISGEKIIFKVLSEKCQPPYSIFDIGANKGQFLDLVMKEIPAKNFKIHCFEPGEGTFINLSERRENDDRVILNKLGIGKQKGTMQLYYDKVGSGLASLTKRKLDHFGIDFNKSEVVQIETIDNYCKKHKIDKISLLKVDVEGHELDAFLGAKEMFAKNAIDVVAFEFGGCNIDSRTYFQDFWYFFADLNMDLFRITPSGRYLFPLESYKEMDEQYRTTNYIAIAKK